MVTIAWTCLGRIFTQCVHKTFYAALTMWISLFLGCQPLTHLCNILQCPLCNGLLRDYYVRRAANEQQRQVSELLENPTARGPSTCGISPKGSLLVFRSSDSAIELDGSGLEHGCRIVLVVANCWLEL